MAQLVCISKDTVREGINEIGDIVAMHEDNVLLAGTGYEGFDIIRIKGKTVGELRVLWRLPEERKAVRLNAVKSWTFLEEKEVWQNEKGAWCDLVARPKYQLSAQSITSVDKNTLDSDAAEEAKATVLRKVREKISMNALNNVEVADLNEVKTPDVVMR